MEKYLAFISYRHRVRDQRVSAQLRKYLESFYLPKSSPIPKRRKCFRDTDELPTSIDLGADIENALQSSGFLIAVCSEEYVNSRWCRQEIKRFIEQGKKDRILPVLVSGTPDTSVPEEIRDLPLALDLRASRGKVSRDQIPKLLHIMSGTDESEIAAADRRHRALVRTGTFGSLGLLLAGVLLYAYLTAQQIKENNEQIARAAEDAKAAQEVAEQQFYDYYLKRTGYIAQKAWTLIRQGRDIEALNAAYNAMPWFTDTPEYAYGLPDPVPLMDAMRAALAVPQRRTVYTSWGVASPWETLEGDDEVDQPEDLPFELTRRYPRQISYIDPFWEEPVVEYTFETTSEDGRFFNVKFETDGCFPEAEMQPVDEECRKAGYTRTFDCPDRSRIFYGTDKPVLLRSAGGQEDLVYCLNKEPFPAKDIWEEPGQAEYFVADGPRGCALFKRDTEEAIAALPLGGAVTCVSYNKNREQIAVIDAEGKLSLFLTRDGTKTREAAESFQYVTYANENYRLYAVTSDGEFRKMNALNMETEHVYDLPRPAKAVCYCALKDTWLVATDRLVFVLDGKTGTLLSGEFYWGELLACYWEGFDEAEYTHGNEGYIIICRDQADISHNDIDQWNPFSSTPLTDKTLPENVTHAFFNIYGEGTDDQEEYIYLQYDNGDLSAWDIDWSDPSDWVNRSEWRSPPEKDRSAAVSRDGTAIWRPLRNGYGVERIDASTGNLLYRVNWTKECDPTLIREDSDSWCALMLGTDYDCMILFNAQYGDWYWTREGAGNAVFSEDGSEILCLEAASAPEDSAGTGAKTLVFRRLDVEAGDVLQEETLCTLDEGEPGKISIDQDTLIATVDGNYQIDLNSLTLEKLDAPPEPEPLFFAQQEVLIEQEAGQTRLVNAQDGHLVLDAGTQQMLLSPSGDKVLLYGGDDAPYVIFAMDSDQLMDNARYMLEDWEEEIQGWQEYSEEEDL